jgi:hypothetical protein
VALVALTPVITLQLFGLIYSIKSKLAKRAMVIPESEDTIIELDYSSREQEDKNLLDGADGNINDNHDTSMDNSVSKGYNKE